MINIEKILCEITKIPKQIVLFFEGKFPYLNLTIERCRETLLSSVLLDIDEKAKAFMLTPLYHGLAILFLEFDDSEKPPNPLQK